MDWKFDANAFRRFEELVNIVSPSMEEMSMASYLREKWANFGAQVQTDVMGNVHAVINSSAKIHIGLVAHMDTVAVQITKILDNGLLNFRSIGLRPHTLLGQSLKVLTSNGLINGVVGFDPTSQYGQPKGLVEEDLWLDIGVRNQEEALREVAVGNLAVLEPKLFKLGTNRICGTGIDDRIGIFVLNEALSLFNKEHSNVCLHLIGTVQEELGLRGAAIVNAQYHLDACFVIDVDYATDTLSPHENQMGRLYLGKGVGLHVKADNNPVLRKLVCHTAKKYEIPYQLSLGRFIYGGTDATSLQLQQNGIATININIPCRYMHSPVENCHQEDVENAIRLIACCLCEFASKQHVSFIPGID